uniref:Uncharacterized protein n=1 Tax=Arundo donax TaxID=35708 RepID=A0A0A9EG74_ARUDO
MELLEKCAVTCNNYVKSIQYIRSLLFVPMQYHRLNLCFTKNFCIDGYVLLDICRLMDYKIHITCF